jgi:hypothetical protein
MLPEVTNRDEEPVARILHGAGFYFSLLCDSEEIRGPHRTYEEAVQDAMEYIKACESLAMWDSMVDT